MAQNLQGTLDEVSVFSEALSAEQVTTLYNLPGNPVLDSYLTWETQLPSGLDDWYHIDIKITDSTGHVSYSSSAWKGWIDTTTPQ